MLTVAIVEDTLEIRNSLLKNIDRMNGVCCIAAYASGEEALNNLPKLQPNLVIMDIGLPKMNGIECMLRLERIASPIQYLMFTVFEDDDEVFEALKVGARGYILKGDGISGVIRAIREYEAGGAPMSRSIASKVLASFNQSSKRTSAVFEHLTRQQRVILELLSKGLLNKEIADRLSISERTVKQHNNAIYKKLQVNNRTEAVMKYLKKD